MVVLLSGGLDSTVLAYWLKDRYPEKTFKALFFDYGQRSLEKELESARWVADKLGMDLRVIRLPKLTGTGVVIPNRNMIMLSIAAGLALAEKRHVWIASHRDDWDVFPDCRPEFIQAMNKAIRLGNDIDWDMVKAPFLFMRKWEIVKLGMELGVPFEKTWTGYKGSEKPCGECLACRERELAFRMAGMR